MIKISNNKTNYKIINYIYKKLNKIEQSNMMFKVKM
jgi:hypothetical protein